MDSKHTTDSGNATAPSGPADSDTHAPERGVEHGVPSEAGEAEPMGLPSSDRHHSETAPAKKGGDSDVPKHDHGAPGSHELPPEG